MGNLDEDFNVVLKKIYADFRASLQLIFEHAIKNGEMSPCDTERLALYSIVVIEGAILTAKASGEAGDYSVAIEMLESYIRRTL